MAGVSAHRKRVICRRVEKVEKNSGISSEFAMPTEREGLVRPDQKNQAVAAA